jgi:hypothetical protein
MPRPGFHTSSGFASLASWRWTAASGLALAGLTSAASTARGLCPATVPSVLWTYPADADVDVPTDAQLLVSGSDFGRPMLNGTELEPSRNGVFPLGSLAPHTRYEIRWRSPALLLSFTTGSGPSSQPAPSAPGRVEVTRAALDASAQYCPFVAQRCLDQGGVRARFDAGLEPLAWLIDEPACGGVTRQYVWPAACGAPFLDREELTICMRLQASDGVRASAATDVFCSAPRHPELFGRARGCQPDGALLISSDVGVPCSSDTTPGPDPALLPSDSSSSTTPLVASESSGGCSIARGPAPLGCGWLVATAAACAWWMRRRSRSAA